MQIKAHILANRTQEVPIPIPIEPVEATVTNGDLYLPYKEVDSQPLITEQTNHYSPYNMNRVIDGVPINFTAWNDFVSLYPSSESWGVADCWIYPTRGSFTLNIGNTLPVGKYVFEVVHFIGYNAYYWSGTPKQPSSRVEVSAVNTRIIRDGVHGVIEAVLNPEQQEYTAVDRYDTEYSTRTIETRVRYAFNIAEGDTTKAFAWGAGTDIDLADLWSAIQLMNLKTDGKTNSHSMGSWVNARIFFRITVYKGA